MIPYNEFETIFSKARTDRYFMACRKDSVKSQELYYLNLQAAKEFSVVISCFEVALRNAIDRHYKNKFGQDWLAQQVSIGFLKNPKFSKSTDKVFEAIDKLGKNKYSYYSHDKLIAVLELSFWRFLFESKQYQSGGSDLLTIFPKMPKGQTFNQTYVFNELEYINLFRNRLAHHEPICFNKDGQNIKSTYSTRKIYNQIMNFFKWMNLDYGQIMNGNENVLSVLVKIDNL